MNFNQAVKRYIQEQNLLSPTDKVLVTLSGGADSVALLLSLLDLKYTCIAVHCNFHLRGEESMRDENFVRNLCEEKQVTLYRKDFQTAEYAKTHHMSIEMAARELRYSYFKALREKIGAQAIAVAHHRDDSVETILLNLMRGTGIDGLQGIRAKNEFIIRPLLGVGRKDILDYLQEKQQNYVTDSTNLEDDYTRNKIRLNLLPLMREINPSVSSSIQQTAERLKGAALFYHQSINAWKEKVVKVLPELTEIDVPKLLSSPAPANLLFEILHPYGFNASQLEDILQSCSSENGKQFFSGTYRLLLSRKALQLFQQNVSSPEQIQIQQEGLFTYPGGQSMQIAVIERHQGFIIDKTRNKAFLDADKVGFPLVLRPVRTGDTFCPFGMKGKKKLLSDFMTDLKFSAWEKERQLLLCNEKDEILWVVGQRTDEHFKITENTHRIIQITLIES